MDANETELNSCQTAWIKGYKDTKIGDAVLTSQRLLFYDKKIKVQLFGAVGSLVADGLAKRGGEKAPQLELPLASITAVTRQKKFVSKDRILLTTADGAYLFSDGFKSWSPLLREALVTTHGRRIVDQGEDS